MTNDIRATNIGYGVVLDILDIVSDLGIWV